ncbi:MAG: TIGR00725 family protein, partial [Dehalococcoidia bacterium]
MKDKLFISVIGASKCSAKEAGLAEEVGRELAKHGAVVICGGLTGVMEAACRGARAEGGLTVGILPGNNRKDANRYVTIPIVTGIGYARNSIVA